MRTSVLGGVIWSRVKHSDRRHCLVVGGGGGNHAEYLQLKEPRVQVRPGMRKASSGSYCSLYKVDGITRLEEDLGGCVLPRPRDPYHVLTIIGLPTCHHLRPGGLFTVTRSRAAGNWTVAPRPRPLTGIDVEKEKSPQYPIPSFSLNLAYQVPTRRSPSIFFSHGS